MYNLTSLLKNNLFTEAGIVNYMQYQLYITNRLVFNLTFLVLAPILGIFVLYTLPKIINLMSNVICRIFKKDQIKIKYNYFIIGFFISLIPFVLAIIIYLKFVNYSSLNNLLIFSDSWNEFPIYFEKNMQNVIINSSDLSIFKSNPIFTMEVMEFLRTFQFIQSTTFGGLKFFWGVDGVALSLILLTTFLFPIVFLSTQNSIKKNIKEFISLFLLVESFTIACFLTLNLFIFYICFETILIPMFLIIGFWGSRKRRIKASYYFFFYTLLGSMLMLLGILLVYSEVGSLNLFDLYIYTFSPNKEKLLWFLFFIGFAVKVPMFPFHIWLPEAHVEAPTAGSMVLAGILLKLGGFGFIRYLLMIFPLASELYSTIIFVLCILGIIYASLTTLRQVDFKRIIAYSSVVHMSLSIIGLFSLTFEGIHGSLFSLLAHGVVSSGLFLCVGILYDRFHTRNIFYYSGLARIMPIFSIFFCILTLSNIGFPGTFGFIGEFLMFLGITNVSLFLLFLSAFIMVLCACYSLWLYNRLMFTQISFNLITNILIKTRKIYKLYWGEFIGLLFLSFFTIFFGLFPNILLNLFNETSNFLMLNHFNNTIVGNKITDDPNNIYGLDNYIVHIHTNEMYAFDLLKPFIDRPELLQDNFGEEISSDQNLWFLRTLLDIHFHYVINEEDLYTRIRIVPDIRFIQYMDDKSIWFTRY